ncbi:C40 family peptidase [Agrococcus sp. Ld7]|uniref:C40 family peptidase n=1 Tax=Agrococcus sp. Ld7 TaxID=649148 RepID=UPI00386953B7
MKHHTTAVEVAHQPARSASASLRRGAKSVGVVSIAAAFIGALSLPAAAFSPQSPQFSDVELASVVAENSQTVSVAGDARIETIARDGISGTTAAELEALRTAAQEAEEARQAELAAAREAAAANSEATSASADTDASTTSAAAAAPAAVSIPANSGIVGIAQSQLGAPYVWGGSSPATGFDCSGFTAWVYGQAGYYVPHSSGAQRGVGTGVPASQVAAGDLLVWNGHVAIYAGNGQIIHAATSGKPVKYSNYAAMVAAFGTPDVRRFG